MLSRLTILGVVLALTGCHATGFDRGSTSMRLEEGVVQADSTLGQTPLAFPCRIAVHLKSPKNNDWRWTPRDKARMEEWAETLQREGIASEVILMSSLFVPDGEAKDLRAAAAKHGADALFIIQGIPETQSRLNPAAVLNLTVLGGFVVPASHRDSLFTMQGGLIDVRTGILYATVESEGEGSIMRPTFLIEEKDAIEKAKQQAITAFGPEVLKRMRNLRAAYSYARP